MTSIGFEIEDVISCKVKAAGESGRTQIFDLFMECDSVRVAVALNLLAQCDVENIDLWIDIGEADPIEAAIACLKDWPGPS